MDNLTHSIIGAAVGAVVQRSLPAEADAASQRLRHRMLLLACVLASNFPDLDMLLSPLLQQPLGYLLHHRGFTHTALITIPQGLLLAGVLWLLWPAARTLLRSSRSARSGLALTIGTGLALHLLMDYTNSYGLHPWYPFDARWFYGDMVFIIEPLFWVVLGVPLAMLVRRPWLRYGWLLLLGAALLALAVFNYLLWPAVLLLGLLAVAGALLQRRAGEHGRAALLLGLGLSVAFLGLQASTSYLGRQAVTAALQQHDSKAQVLDVAMTAFPSMPLCWAYASVESNPKQGYYRLRRGVLSLAPALDCPAALAGSEAREVLSPQVVEFAHVMAPLVALQELNQKNCVVQAWLRFARLPALTLATGTLADYRFAATPKGNFSTLETVGQPVLDCPRGVPQWDYPRRDLLTQPAIGIF